MGNKNDRIKRTKMIQRYRIDTEYGISTNMLYLQVLITNMKISWIERLYKSDFIRHGKADRHSCVSIVEHYAVVLLTDTNFEIRYSARQACLLVALRCREPTSRQQHCPPSGERDGLRRIGSEPMQRNRTG